MQVFGNKKGGKHSGGSNNTERAEAHVQREDEYIPQSDSVEKIKEKRSKKAKKKKTRKVILTILIILAVLLVGAYIAIEYFTEPPDTDNSGLKGDEDKIEAGVTNGRYNGMYTFMVVGLDKVGNNTDTIMVGCLNVVDGELNVINIPRDTLINSGYNVKKINYVYPACINNNKDAIGELKLALEDMLGFGIDKYAVIDISAAEQIVDTIGGVEFDVPTDMHYDDPVQDLHINIDAGLQKLNGEQTVQVLRFRNTYAGGDIQRIGVQQDLFKAMASQILSLGNVPNIGKLIDIVENNTETDLTADNIRFYIKEFLLLDKDNINFYTLPGDTSGSIFGLSYVYPYIDEWLELVNDKINPWEKKVDIENVNMVTYANGNFYSTTGELKGGVTSFMHYEAGTSVAGAGVYPYTSSVTDNTN
ncbi:MAG: LCP family protein [Oscillospiraceae bacterium]|nr:LCP family protein [Oscillospiraceae bacterium]